LPPIAARVVARSFDTGRAELRVTSAINETAKIEEEA